MIWERKNAYKSGGKLLMIPVRDIRPNPDQPRTEFRTDRLLELAQSIGENGLLNPVTVTMTPDGPVLVAGERRWRAAKMAGIREIPCIVSDADEQQRAVLALVENLQREDMNCFEQAEGIGRLIEVYHLTQEDAAIRLGCAPSTVANKLRLLRLSPEERGAILRAGLTERHARALLRISGEEQRQTVLSRVVREHMTVARTERLVEDVLHGRGLRRQAVKPIVRDIRLFSNTVNHALETMRRSGIPAISEQSETEEFYEYHIRIPKAEVKCKK